MNNFQNFQQTKVMMTPKEFNKKNNDNIDDYGDLYVYKDYFYIHYNPRSKGLSKPYSLTIGNQCYDSNNLEILEIKLYNDWFIENIAGSEEWLPYVGIHTRHTSGHYYIMFQSMGFNVEDISYGNDSVDTFRLSINNIELFDVLLPNSANNNSDEEQFNQFVVHNLERSSFDDSQFDRCDEGINADAIYDNIVDMQESFECRFHAMARDYMNKVIDSMQIEDGDYEPTSLDEFLIKMKAYETDGNSILKIWDSWNILNESMTFGCEPKNMFEDGVDEMGAFDENGDAKEYTWNGHEYNPLGDTKEYDSNEAASMDSEIRNLETKYQASQSEITELETRVTNLSFQYEVLQNKLSNAISPTKHQCTINRLESQISIKDAKIQSQMKKINNLITK